MYTHITINIIMVTIIISGSSSLMIYIYIYIYIYIHTCTHMLVPSRRPSGSTGTTPPGRGTITSTVLLSL